MLLSAQYIVEPGECMELHVGTCVAIRWSFNKTLVSETCKKEVCKKFKDPTIPQECCLA